MKVAIICIAKYEEKYIKEWVDYHLNLGFDNIIIGDNDDEPIMPSIINDSRVIFKDYRKMTSKYSFQSIAYTEMINEYKHDYDWITFIDCDEFIVLEDKYNNDIKNFLAEDIFSDKDIIRLHWKCFSDGEMLNVINNDYSVVKRFTELSDTKNNSWGKSFLRTSSLPNNCKIKGGHGYFDKSLKACNAIGEECINMWATVNRFPLYENAWINHYPTKTIGEYINQKYFRGGPNNNNVKYGSIKYFFEYNKRTDEKEKYGNDLIHMIMRKQKKIPAWLNIGYKFNPK